MPSHNLPILAFGLALALFGTPILLLTTTGRNSGEQRTTPLIHRTDGDRWVVVASKGGAPAHPAHLLRPAVPLFDAPRLKQATSEIPSGGSA